MGTHARARKAGTDAAQWMPRLAYMSCVVCQSRSQQCRSVAVCDVEILVKMSIRTVAAIV
jgi:hypothetical protein